MHRYGVWILSALLLLMSAGNVSARARNEICTACDGEWSPWSTVNGLDGLDFRTCRGGYDDNAEAYNWYVEWRNRYAADIYFDYAVTRTDAAPGFRDGGIGIIRGGYGCSWGLAARDDIFIWVDCVRLGEDAGPLYRCGTFCECSGSDPTDDPDTGSVEFQGRLSFRFRDGAAVIGAERIANGRNSGTRPLRLNFWATQEPFSGGTIRGYRLAAFPIGEIEPGRAVVDFEKGADHSQPPEGIYHLTLTLTEVVNGSDIIVDYANFNETKAFAGEEGNDSGSGCFIDVLAVKNRTRSIFKNRESKWPRPAGTTPDRNRSTSLAPSIGSSWSEIPSGKTGRSGTGIPKSIYRTGAPLHGTGR